jgi:hypothetical protein
MIGLVFSTPPPEKKQKTRSWWQDIPRELWKATYKWEALSRLRVQKRIEEPTAPRQTPDWQRRWNKSQEPPESYARVESVPDCENE